MSAATVPLEFADRTPRPQGQGWRERHREPRVGVMLHYDGSGSDSGAQAWFRDPRASKVGYHWLVLDDGRVVLLAPYEARVYHAGICRPSPELMAHGAVYSDANSALIGISIAATDGDIALPRQILSTAALCRYVFDREGWPPDETWRITTHSAEAWARGRKIDPEGSDPRKPVLDPRIVRHLTPLVRPVEAA